MSGPRIQYTKTSDGVSIAYWALGKGTPIMFLPPLIVSDCQQEWEIPEWQGWFEELAQHRRIARYDSRGSGLSDRDVPIASVEELLSDLEAVADALGWDRFAILGSNWSGLLAMEFAARRPDRVSHLLLWCSPLSGAREQSRSLSLRPLAEANWHLYTNMVALMTFGWEAGALGRSFARYMEEAVSQERFLELADMMYEFDAEALLDTIRTPTLIIHRRELESPPVSVARRIASSIPNARLALLEGHSAVPFLENEAAVLTAINEFLGEQPSDAAQQLTADVHVVLFTDIESSSELAQRHGDAVAHAVRRTHDRIVREALAQHRGSEVKHTGDGIMAAFAMASQALECSIAIQRGVAASVEEHPETPLAVYIGLNAGEPIAENSDLFGTSVDLAARICSQAEPGQILASDVVRQLAAGKRFLFSDHGEAAMRGFEDPVRLWEVRWREDE